ncbi:MAG: hypothetical protein AAGE52_18830 [Myxococcota bacterium]
MQVRGHVLRRHLNYTEERFGLEVLEDALGRCSKGVANALRSAVVEGGLYPVVWLNSFHEALAAAADDPEALWELGHDTTPRAVRDATGLGLHLKSMWSVIQQLPRVLQDEFQGSTLELEIDESGNRAVMSYRCPGFSRLTWQMVEGGVVGLLEAAGAHRVEVAPLEGGSDNDDHYRFCVSYQGRPSIPPRPAQ